MKPKYYDVLNKLIAMGWTVELNEARRNTLPIEILQRFEQIPGEVIDFITSITEMVAPDEKSWFLCWPDYAPATTSAYQWNEWELQSLDSAAGDVRAQSEIRSFWNSHFPIMLSVKSGYAYFAVRMSDASIVVGEEPYYESPTVIAPKFFDFLQHVCNSDSHLARFI